MSSIRYNYDTKCQKASAKDETPCESFISN